MKTGTEWTGTKHTIYQAVMGLRVVTGLVSLDPRALRHSRVARNDDSFCLV